MADDKRAAALDLGADLALDPSAEVLPDALHGIAVDASASVVLDVVGTDSSLELASRCIAPRGLLIIVGLGGGTTPVGFLTMQPEMVITNSYWGTPSEPTSAVRVATDVLAKYVGTYSGFWLERPRTVHVSLSGEQLLATIDDATQAIPLVALSETLFESAEGLSYRFLREGSNPATAVEEIHVSGDYKLERRR